MRINDIVVLENNKKYILTNKYDLDNNIYYLAYELLDNEKTDKFVFVKEVYDDGYYVILEKNEDILLKLITKKIHKLFMGFFMSKCLTHYNLCDNIRHEKGVKIWN